VTHWVHIELSLVGPKLKWVQKLGKLSITNQVMAVSEPVVTGFFVWLPELITRDRSQKWSDFL